MNPVDPYSPFVEHSFRRLSLVIHQQEALNASDHSPDKPSIFHNDSTRTSKNVKAPSPCPTQLDQPSLSNADSDSIESTSGLRNHRTYMRPPKSRTNVSRRTSLTQLVDRIESSFSQSNNSMCSPSPAAKDSQKWPSQTPCGRSLYDVRFEVDRQNDLREKYNIPPPFERTWLRQPRYVPQDRPRIGQMKQMSED